MSPSRQEWYHETHLNLKQPSRVHLPLNANPDDPSAPGVLLRDGEYAALACESCVLADRYAPLTDYFGTPRFVGLVAGEGGKWDRAGGRPITVAARGGPVKAAGTDLSIDRPAGKEGTDVHVGARMHSFGRRTRPESRRTA
jgi:hypothetical protein